MRTAKRVVGLVLLALIAQGSRADDGMTDEDIQVAVSRNGDAIQIRAEMPVAASARQVWRVLTDYDNMTAFSPDLTSSRAVPMARNRMRVEQTGLVSFGPFRFTFESVRDIELQPYREIRSQAVAGSIKSGFALTRLRERDGVTHVEYQSESVPEIQLPFGLGLGTVEARTRQQFFNLRREIYQRMQEQHQASVR